MYFWDEKKRKSVENCPSCGSIFIIDKGTKCSATCPVKKLENKHRKEAEKMVAHCLRSNKKVRIEFPPKTYLFEKGDKEKGIIRWGWTDDLSQVIYIPWYTLRNKKEFFDTMAHEIGHITACEKKFAISERNILEKLFLLEEKEEEAYNAYDFDEFIAINREIRKIKKDNKKLINKYCKWDGHDYKIWYQEYLRLFDKLLNSPKKLNFKKYAYGNFNPIPYNNCKGRF